MSWQPIETAILDGRTVWVAAKPFILGVSVEQQEKIKYSVFLAMYDTWNAAWRMLQSGEMIALPKYFPPALWHVCIRPERPDEVKS